MGNLTWPEWTLGTVLYCAYVYILTVSLHGDWTAVWYRKSLRAYEKCSRLATIFLYICPIYAAQNLTKCDNLKVL